MAPSRKRTIDDASRDDSDITVPEPKKARTSQNSKIADKGILLHDDGTVTWRATPTAEKEFKAVYFDSIRGALLEYASRQGDQPGPLPQETDADAYHADSANIVAKDMATWPEILCRFEMTGTEHDKEILMVNGHIVLNSVGDPMVHRPGMPLVLSSTQKSHMIELYFRREWGMAWRELANRMPPGSFAKKERGMNEALKRWREDVGLKAFKAFKDSGRKNAVLDYRMTDEARAANSILSVGRLSERHKMMREIAKICHSGCARAVPGWVDLGEDKQDRLVAERKIERIEAYRTTFPGENPSLLQIDYDLIQKKQPDFPLWPATDRQHFIPGTVDDGKKTPEAGKDGKKKADKQVKDKSAKGAVEKKTKLPSGNSYGSAALNTLNEGNFHQIELGYDIQEAIRLEDIPAHFAPRPTSVTAQQTAVQQQVVRQSMPQHQVLQHPPVATNAEAQVTFPQQYSQQYAAHSPYGAMEHRRPTMQPHGGAAVAAQQAIMAGQYGGVNPHMGPYSGPKGSFHQQHSFNPAMPQQPNSNPYMPQNRGFQGGPNLVNGINGVQQQPVMHGFTPQHQYNQVNSVAQGPNFRGYQPANNANNIDYNAPTLQASPQYQQRRFTAPAYERTVNDSQPCDPMSLQNSMLNSASGIPAVERTAACMDVLPHQDNTPAYQGGDNMAPSGPINGEVGQVPTFDDEAGQFPAFNDTAASNLDLNDMDIDWDFELARFDEVLAEQAGTSENAGIPHTGQPAQEALEGQANTGSAVGAFEMEGATAGTLQEDNIPNEHPVSISPVLDPALVAADQATSDAVLVPNASTGPVESIAEEVNAANEVPPVEAETIIGHTQEDPQIASEDMVADNEATIPKTSDDDTDSLFAPSSTDSEGSPDGHTPSLVDDDEPTPAMLAEDAQTPLEAVLAHNGALSRGQQSPASAPAPQPRTPPRRFEQQSRDPFTAYINSVLENDSPSPDSHHVGAGYDGRLPKKRPASDVFGAAAGPGQEGPKSRSNNNNSRPESVERLLETHSCKRVKLTPVGADQLRNTNSETESASRSVHQLAVLASSRPATSLNNAPQNTAAVSSPRSLPTNNAAPCSAGQNPPAVNQPQNTAATDRPIINHGLRTRLRELVGGLGIDNHENMDAEFLVRFATNGSSNNLAQAPTGAQNAARRQALIGVLDDMPLTRLQYSALQWIVHTLTTQGAVRELRGIPGGDI